MTSDHSRRSRTLPAVVGVERVAFSFAEWRSFQRHHARRLGAAAAASSDTSASAAAATSDLLAAIAAWSHDTHAVFAVVAVGERNLLFSLGNFVTVRHGLAPTDIVPRDRLLIGLIRFFVKHEATSTLYACLTALLPRLPAPSEPHERPLRVSHVTQYKNDIARFDFGNDEFVRVAEIVELVDFLA